MGSSSSDYSSLPAVPFSFSPNTTTTTSFTDLLNSGDVDAVSFIGSGGGRMSMSSWGLADHHHRHLLHRRSADRSGSGSGAGVPKFKSLPPPSLPISSPAAQLLSPSSSSLFAIPPGLSPAELLDSPVLLTSSNVSTAS
ncbi:WRKY transcription factor [Dionaea muscipula]